MTDFLRVDVPVWVEAPAQADAPSEGAFMDDLLAQIEAGEIEPLVQIPDGGSPPAGDADWQAVEDEEIGEDFSRYPFLY